MKNLHALSEAIILAAYTVAAIGGSLLIIYGIYQFAVTVLPGLVEAGRPF